MEYCHNYQGVPSLTHNNKELLVNLMSTLSLSISVDAHNSARYVVKHTTSKIESTDKSVFQRIGLAYRLADFVAYSYPSNRYASKADFVGDMLHLGFSRCHSEELLRAKKWDARMTLVWSYLDPTERELSQALDYSELENYWPNLDFLELDCTSPYRTTEDYFVTTPM